MEPHKHIELAPGAVANVAPDVQSATVEALGAMVGLIQKAKRRCVRCGNDFTPDEPTHNTCAECAYFIYLSQF